MSDSPNAPPETPDTSARQPSRAESPHAEGSRAGTSLSQVWVAFALGLPLVLVAASPMGTVDLTYHIRAGQLMIDSGALVRADSFTFTAAGLEWVDQQWLAQVALAQAFRLGGWLALALVRTAVAAVTLVLLYAACREQGAHVRAAAWLTLGGAALLLPGMLLRPQLLGAAAFAATLWLLAQRHRRPHRLWWIAPVVLLWANLHGTFFLAIGLIGLAWIHDVHAGNRTAWRLVAVGLTSIAATMVNPYGPSVWTYVLQLSGNPAVRGMVAEWQPTSIDSYSGAAFLLSGLLVAVMIGRARVTMSWPVLLSLGTFFLIGLMSVRGVYWWAMVMPVVVAGSSVAHATTTRPDPRTTWHSALVGVVCAMALLPHGRWLPHRGGAPAPTALLVDAPRGITDALTDALGTDERFFGAQVWGSWFEFALPSHPVAVDSRIELFPAEVWERYADISNAREGWQAMLDQWGVRVVALHHAQQAHLLRRIAHDSAWRQVHADHDGAVFVRR